MTGFLSDWWRDLFAIVGVAVPIIQAGRTIRRSPAKPQPETRGQSLDSRRLRAEAKDRFELLALAVTAGLGLLLTFVFSLRPFGLTETISLYASGGAMCLQFGTGAVLLALLGDYIHGKLGQAASGIYSAGLWLLCAAGTAGTFVFFNDVFDSPPKWYTVFFQTEFVGLMFVAAFALLFGTAALLFLAVKGIIHRILSA